MKSLPCPCGRARSYEDCCGTLHRSFEESGRLAAPDAEALMRSRYSAFALDKLDYLLATWHASRRPAALAPNEAGMKWLGLEVKRHLRQDENHATVEFVARSKQGGRAQRLHETSRFVREDGAWFYVDGDIA
ncbi:YchJ family metal-binding protein [Pelomonas sp. V22]|uniref:YchJ family protein n=1 Tax=Pelomonas sp. V22 TaxID=2822139 RepID=UPI0024A9985C|nr:YchJ family metal-binding protein [Pelomonas sp. V22]